MYMPNLLYKLIDFLFYFNIETQDKSAFLQLSVCSSFPPKNVDSRYASGGEA